MGGSSGECEGKAEPVLWSGSGAGMAQLRTCACASQSSAKEGENDPVDKEGLAGMKQTPESLGLILVLVSYKVSFPTGQMESCLSWKKGTGEMLTYNVGDIEEKSVGRKNYVKLLFAF